MVNVVYEPCPNCTTGRRYHAANGVMCVDCGYVEALEEYNIRVPQPVFYHFDTLELVNPALGAYGAAGTV